ncbi:MAG: prenyltransferase/squalene oxidase repeat-containing protein [Bacteroidia bacterium]|nr:prenyltransferase/squalene oxidase repeat-containing protein [Bacteroidia bacterium]
MNLIFQTAACLLLGCLTIAGHQESFRLPAAAPARQLPPPSGETVTRALAYLAEAQNPDGGWGGGSHTRQDIRDPHAVQSDPATTAFSAMALLRAGHTLTSGAYQQHLARALGFLLLAVEQAPAGSPTVTHLQGTQPQVKLGQNIDVSMTSQLLTRIKPYASHDPSLTARIEAAQAVCLNKLQSSISQTGEVSGGTWAGVLQSAVATNALEEAYQDGATVDEVVVTSARKYQVKNIDAGSGEVKTEKAAGIQLYSLAGTTRATAKEAKRAEAAVREARDAGTLSADAPVSTETLKQIGYDDAEASSMAEDYNANQAAVKAIQNESVLSGFGNNGGEEFLSFMMTSEAMALQGGDAWTQWRARMENTLTSIQNPDGSYSGHHCITSPVFCTAAVVLTLTATPEALASQDKR